MLTSVDAIIDAVGGTTAAAKLAGVSPPAVSNWRERRRIPSDWVLIFADRLAKLGKPVADPRVFGLRSARRRG